MVKGLDLFLRRLGRFDGQFVLIGGVACDVLHEDAGLPFRPTKDIDIVLCVEALSNEFIGAFWDFVREGGYEMRQRSDGTPKRYRFLKPADHAYPFMLELFSRKSEALEVPEGQHIVPIPSNEEGSGLSAILLDESYYRLMKEQRLELAGVPIVGPAGLLLLKAKAYIDLRTRKEHGEQIQEHDIVKHRADVFRLYRLLEPGLMLAVDVAIRRDLRMFIERMGAEEVDLRRLGIMQETKEEIMQALERMYIVSSS